MNLLSLILLALSSGINVHQNYHWSPENLVREKSSGVCFSNT